MKRQTPTKPEPAFGKRLRQHRQKAAMTLADLANAVRVDQAELSNMEDGAERPPGINILMRMADALRVKQGSEEFEELWRLAEQERHPDGNAAEYIASMKDLTKTVLWELVQDLQQTDTPSGGDVPVLPTFVPDVAAMITEAKEEIARRPPAAMTLHFADGTTKTWRVVGTTQERRDV